MKKYAFISRHLPTQEQINLAAEQGIILSHVGDVDAFAWNGKDLPNGKSLPEFRGTQGYIKANDTDYDGVIVVHPVMALKAINQCPVGIFENGMRPVEGGAPQFEAKSLQIYSLSGNDPYAGVAKSEA